MRVQEVEAAKISRQLSHEGGKVVNTTQRQSLLSREDPWYSHLSQAE